MTSVFPLAAAFLLLACSNLPGMGTAAAFVKRPVNGIKIHDFQNFVKRDWQLYDMLNGKITVYGIPEIML